MDAIVNLGSKEAEIIGFTPDKFDGYLWIRDSTVIISFIISLEEGKGNLKKLFENIREAGFGRIQVPTPSAKMEHLCKRWGFTKKIERDELFGAVEILEKIFEAKQ